MKLYSLLLLAAVVGPAAAAPVHIALKSVAAVSSNADGFFLLASVADLSGGDLASRKRLGSVSVGRAPLLGEVRRLTLGDLALKLRQAGCNPDKDVVLDGVGEVSVTTVGAGLAPALVSAPAFVSNSGLVYDSGLVSESGLSRPGRAGASPAPTVQSPIIRSGTPVTILIQSGALNITAPGIARQSGGVGDCIRVHRDGVMTDLYVTILDEQTVRLEI